MAKYLILVYATTNKHLMLIYTTHQAGIKLNTSTKRSSKTKKKRIILSKKNRLEETLHCSLVDYFLIATSLTDCAAHFKSVNLIGWIAS